MKIREFKFALGFVACVLSMPSLGAEEPPPAQVLFKNVNIFNGTEDRLYENHQVLVEGNLIKAISAGEIETRAGATVIDGGGRTLMPDLTDAQVSGCCGAPFLNLQEKLSC